MLGEFRTVVRGDGLYRAEVLERKQHIDDGRSDALGVLAQRQVPDHREGC